MPAWCLSLATASHIILEPCACTSAPCSRRSRTVSALPISDAACKALSRFVVFGVHISAVLEEQLHNSSVAQARCHSQRLILFNVHVCAVLEEDLRNVRVAFLRCIPQRPVVISMHISAVLDEQLHHSCVALMRCKPQRPVVISVHVCAVLDEELHHSCVATPRCILQRVIVISVHVCARTKQQFHRLDVPATGCAVQGSVNKASLVLAFGLQQRRAVLVHAGHYHGAGDSHVAKRSSTLQATAVLNPL
jgi:hypothetical protein